MNRKDQIQPLKILGIIFGLIIAFVILVSVSKKPVEEKQEVIQEPEIISSVINNTNKDVIYLAKGGTYKLNYSFVSNKEKTLRTLNYTSADINIAQVSLSGEIKGIDNGETDIIISIDNLKESIHVLVTDLLLPIRNDLQYTKPNLSCDQVSEEENDLLDSILKDRINDAGYGTRAGVVAAARFLLLELPYRISYFFENGRIGYADGEGRYYHEGLYLNKSRYSNLKSSSEFGPACWGCSMHSRTANDTEQNGLDCSGLVTWALLNGGFDCGDVGAGGVGYNPNTLFFLGERENTSKDNFNKIQAGDLVHNKKAGGHIGIVIGVEKEKIYVAQATWQDPSIFTKPYGVTVTEYNIEEFIKDWKEVMLMDSYYKESGNYSAMW